MIEIPINLVYLLILMVIWSFLDLIKYILEKKYGDREPNKLGQLIKTKTEKYLENRKYGY